MIAVVNWKINNLRKKRGNEQHRIPSFGERGKMKPKEAGLLCRYCEECLLYEPVTLPP